MEISLKTFFSKDVVGDAVEISHIMFYYNLSIGSDFMPEMDKNIRCKYFLSFKNYSPVNG